jgi:hypothetical protein
MMIGGQKQSDLKTEGGTAESPRVNILSIHTNAASRGTSDIIDR